MNPNATRSGMTTMVALLTGAALGALAMALITSRKPHGPQKEAEALKRGGRTNARETGRSAKQVLDEFQRRNAWPKAFLDSKTLEVASERLG